MADTDVTAITDLAPPALLALAPRIRAASITEVVLRKHDPTWRFALAANPTNPGLLLQLRTAEGTTGLGLACEIRHLGHELATMRAALQRVLPLLTRADPDPEPLAAIDRLGGPARAILQLALLDLVARDRGRPAHALLGPLRRRSVALTRILSLKSPEKMAAMAAAHAAEGYRHVKIKLDHGPDDVDYRRVAAIRVAVGSDVGLTVDANQSYPPQDAIALSARLAPLGVLLFEQPVPADDLDGLAEVTRHAALPIEADEAADSLDRVRLIAARGAAHGISVKVPKLGGLDRAAEAIRICAEAGLHVRIGAHVGSRLLNAAALHLAVTLDGLTEPAELAEFARLDGDPITGLDVSDGRLIPPDGPGFGVRREEKETP